MEIHIPTEPCQHALPPCARSAALLLVDQWVIQCRCRWSCRLFYRGLTTPVPSLPDCPGANWAVYRLPSMLLLVCLFSTPTWPCDATSPGPSLTEGPRTYQFPTGGAGLPVSERTRSTVSSPRTPHGDGRCPMQRPMIIHGLLYTSDLGLHGSSMSAALFVTRTNWATIGDRGFVAAAPTPSCAWNDLPPTLASAQALQSFRNELKTELFVNCFQSTVKSMFY